MLLWLVEPTPLVVVCEVAAEVGVAATALLVEVLLVAVLALLVEVAGLGVADVAEVAVLGVVEVVDPLAPALAATPATSVAPSAAPAVATPAAASDARRIARLGRFGGGFVMSTTIAVAGSSQPQPTVKHTSRSPGRGVCSGAGASSAPIDARAALVRPVFARS